MSTIAGTVAIQVGNKIGRQLVKIRWWYQGRGCGRYFPRGAAQEQYQQHGKYGGPPQQYGGRSLQPYQVPSQQYGQNINYQGFQGPSTNVKRNNNLNYCHTPGFDVKDENDSSNCRNPIWNHNWQATHENKMVRSQRNKSKTYLPSQVSNPSPP